MIMLKKLISIATTIAHLPMNQLPASTTAGALKVA